MDLERMGDEATRERMTRPRGATWRRRGRGAARRRRSSSKPARETLDRELRAVKDDVLRMGSLVEEALREAVRP